MVTPFQHGFIAGATIATSLITLAWVLYDYAYSQGMVEGWKKAQRQVKGE